ncbi:hypothetical protein SDC9_138033 [bioreactor metagenome]|uniref:Uncharacterized protein n=1 Tax=bioreactor metagenome TaxID=1076179 RepID=A0A645DN73_9ZZZZ
MASPMNITVAGMLDMMEEMSAVASIMARINRWTLLPIFSSSMSRMRLAVGTLEMAADRPKVASTKNRVGLGKATRKSFMVASPKNIGSTKTKILEIPRGMASVTHRRIAITRSAKVCIPDISNPCGTGTNR